MVAMLITLVGVLGLLQVTNVMTEQNLRNATRDEALQIAEQYMANFRSGTFDQILSSPSPYEYAPVTVRSGLRGVTTSYTVNRTVTAVTDSSKLIQVRARWKFKNASTSQGLQTVIAKPTQSP
jgi:Tfp pilus assembly protein PilV